MKYIAFVLLVIICNINSLSAIKHEDTELVLVHVLFRHGARTTSSFYPNDPYQNETFYPYGLGQLTNEGKKGEYKLGKYFRSIYGEFLGDDWDKNKAYIRSTDKTRTKMSAQLVLAGLFPPSKDLSWNDELKWIPIPVDFVKINVEDLFSGGADCPYKDVTKDALLEKDEVKRTYIEPYQEVYDYLEKHSGKLITYPGNVLDLYFNLKCEDDMNYTLPEWTKSIYPHPIEDIGALTYELHNLDHKLRQINAGFMLQKILRHSEDKINNKLIPPDRKIYLYAGHESNVGKMLNALNVTESHIPAYGSAIHFELHKKEEKYFVKLRYRNNSDALEPVELTVPGCHNLCPFDKFKKLHRDLLPTVSMDKACNR